MVELLVIVGVVAILVSMLLPVVRNAREQAARVQCASNLRQVGVAEALYAAANRGYLLARDGGHPMSVGDLVHTSKPYYSINLSTLMDPRVWFCPRTQIALDGSLLSDQTKIDMVKGEHRTGYAFLGPSWNPAGFYDRNAQPCWGTIERYMNRDAFKITQLKSWQVRVTEWHTYSVPDPGKFWYGGPFCQPNHADTSGKAVGGNVLLADGSVHWSRNILEYLGCYYIMPE